MTDFRNNAAAAGSLGLRTNNPMNVRPFTILYKGQTGVSNNGGAIFQSVEYGLRAGAMELYINYVKHGYNTLTKTISDFSPSSDGNDTAAYIAYVSKKTGIAPNEIFSLNKANLAKIMEAMINVEIGSKYAKYITKTMINNGIDLLNYPELKKSSNKRNLILASLLIFAFVKSN